jgi:cob(I)alamin adenosyltransferase
MGISTGRGDGGDTDLYQGGRVRKDHPRVEVCGQLDELSAALGLARSSLTGNLSAIAEEIGRIQDDLLAMGSVVSTPGPRDPGSGWKEGEEPIRFLEKRIQALEEALPPLRNFIRPAGPSAAASLHLARAICRRVERRLVSMAETEGIPASIQIYLNRLGDLIFLWAREVHRITGLPEEPWSPQSQA